MQLLAAFSLSRAEQAITALPERFVAWCRLLYARSTSSSSASNSTSIVRLIADTKARWIPTTAGLMCLDANNPVVYAEDKPVSTALALLNHHHAWVPLLDPRVVAVFGANPWLRQCCSWMGILTVDLRAIVSRVILPIFAGVGHNPASSVVPATGHPDGSQVTLRTAEPAEATEARRDAVIAAAGIVRLWLSKVRESRAPVAGAGNQASTADDAKLLQKLRAAFVILTSQGRLVRFAACSDSELPAGAEVLPRVHVHLHHSMLAVGPRRDVAEALEHYLQPVTSPSRTSGEAASADVAWHTVSTTYVEADFHARAAITRDGVVSDWVGLFTLLGATESFSELPSKYARNEVNALIPWALLTYQRTPGAQNQTSTNSDAADGRFVSPELALVIKGLMAAHSDPACSRDERLRVRSALVCILNSLRVYLDIETPAAAALCAWLRETPWLPALPRSDQQQQLRLLSASSLALPSLSQTYGNWADYVDYAVAHHAASGSNSPHEHYSGSMTGHGRGTGPTSAVKQHQTYGGLQLTGDTVCVALGIMCAPASSTATAILHELAAAAADAALDGQLARITPHVTAPRFVSKKSTLVGSDCIAKPTIVVTGDILGRLYAEIKEPEAVSSALPFAIPCHSDRDGSDDWGGPLCCRFQLLADGHLVHEDGAKGMLSAADVWSAWQAGKPDQLGNRHHRDSSSEKLRLYQSETPVYEAIRHWSHSVAPGESNTETNEQAVWRAAMTRLQQRHRAAVAGGDAAARSKVLDVAYSVLAHVSNPGKAHGKMLCIGAHEHITPRLRPILVPGVTVYPSSHSRPAVGSASGNVDGHGGVADSSLPSIAQPASTSNNDARGGAVEELVLIDATPAAIAAKQKTSLAVPDAYDDSDTLETRPSGPSASFSDADPVYIINDNAPVAAKMMEHYSRIPAGRARPIVLLHVPDVVSDGDLTMVRSHIRRWMINDPTICSLSLQGKLVETPPAAGAVAFVTLNPMQRYWWAHTCRCLQQAISELDPFTYGLLQSEGVSNSSGASVAGAGVALCSISRDLEVASTRHLNVAYTLKRPYGSETEAPFIVHTECCASRLMCESDGDWYLYAESTALGDHSIASVKSWCSAAVQYLLQRLSPHLRSDQQRLDQLMAAMQERLDETFVSAPAGRSGLAGVVVRTTGRPDPPGQHWFNATDLVKPSDDALTSVHTSQPASSMAALDADAAAAAVAAAAVLSEIGSSVARDAGGRLDGASGTSDAAVDSSAAAPPEGANAVPIATLAAIGQHTIARQVARMERLVAEGKVDARHASNSMPSGIHNLGAISQMLHEERRSASEGYGTYRHARAPPSSSAVPSIPSIPSIPEDRSAASMAHDGDDAGEVSFTASVCGHDGNEVVAEEEEERRDGGILHATADQSGDVDGTGPALVAPNSAAPAAPDLTAAEPPTASVARRHRGPEAPSRVHVDVNDVYGLLRDRHHRPSAVTATPAALHASRQPNASSPSPTHGADVADQDDNASERGAPFDLEVQPSFGVSHPHQYRRGPEPSVVDLPVPQLPVPAMVELMRTLTETAHTDDRLDDGSDSADAADGATADEHEAHDGATGAGSELRPNIAVSSAIKASTGRAAELIVFETLTRECLRIEDAEEQNAAASSSSSAGGADILLPSYSVEWMNKDRESGLPFDIIVKRGWRGGSSHAAADTDADADGSGGGGSTSSHPDHVRGVTVLRYVEVKGTRQTLGADTHRLSIPITPAEVAFAHRHPSEFELWFVTGLGTSSTTITRVSNPVALINQPPPLRLGLHLDLMAHDHDPHNHGHSQLHNSIPGRARGGGTSNPAGVRESVGEMSARTGTGAASEPQSSLPSTLGVAAVGLPLQASAGLPASENTAASGEHPTPPNASLDSASAGTGIAPSNRLVGSNSAARAAGGAQAVPPSAPTTGDGSGAIATVAPASRPASALPAQTSRPPASSSSALPPSSSGGVAAVPKRLQRLPVPLELLDWVLTPAAADIFRQVRTTTNVDVVAHDPATGMVEVASGDNEKLKRAVLLLRTHFERQIERLGAMNSQRLRAPAVNRGQPARGEHMPAPMMGRQSTASLVSDGPPAGLPRAAPPAPRTVASTAAPPSGAPARPPAPAPEEPAAASAGGRPVEPASGVMFEQAVLEALLRANAEGKSLSTCQLGQMIPASVKPAGKFIDSLRKAAIPGVRIVPDARNAGQFVLSLDI